MPRNPEIHQRARRVVRSLLAVVVLSLGLAGTGFNNTEVAYAAPAGTLVLYDAHVDAQYDYLGELYGTMAANLVSRFGRVTAHPVEDYTADEMANYRAVVYLGNSYRSPETPLSLVFLDDVLAGNTPVLWSYFNIWELQWRYNALHPATSFAAKYGFTTGDLVADPIAEIVYQRNLRSFELDRDPENNIPLVGVKVTDPTKTTVLATAIPIAKNSTPFNWAVKSANFTYVADEGLSYITESSGYLAYCDLLIATIAPNTPERHRALVRLEDVSPVSDPAALRSIADLLEAEGVPFSMHVIPTFVDAGIEGRPAETIELTDRPGVVSALQYVTRHGGRLIMHGYTHQLENLANPYNGVSGDDFEFYRAHIDSQTNYVIFDGPVADDSVAWSGARLDHGLARIAAAGLPRPKFFTTPHYAASVYTYEALRQRFEARYERSLYYKGTLSHTTVEPSQNAGQFFPWAVTDVYGANVIPESLGNETEAYNQHPGRTPQEIIASAYANLAVRDGVGSFFWHPWLVGAGSIEHLRTIVRGIKDAGFTFVTPESLLGELPAGTPPTTQAPATIFQPASSVAPSRGSSGSDGLVGPATTVWANAVGPVRPVAPTVRARPGEAHFEPEARRPPEASPAAPVVTAPPGGVAVTDPSAGAPTTGSSPAPVEAPPLVAVAPAQVNPQPVVAVPPVSSPAGSSSAGPAPAAGNSPVVVANPPTPTPTLPPPAAIIVVPAKTPAKTTAKVIATARAKAAKAASARRKAHRRHVARR